MELQFGAKSFVKFLKRLYVQQEDDPTLEKLLAMYPDFGQATQALLESGRIVIPALGENKTRLSIQTVYEQLMTIAKDEGAGGVARKQELALRLLQKCR